MPALATEARAVPPKTPGRAFARPKRLKLSFDALHVCLCMLTVMTVSRFHQHFSFLSALRPALLMVAFAFLYAVINPRLLSQKGLFFSAPPKALAGFVIMTFLSVALGISTGAAGKFFLEEWLPVPIFAGLLILSIRTASDLWALVWSFVIGVGILSYFAVFVFQLRVEYGTARLSNLYMYDANDAGLVLIVGIPLTLLTFHCSRWRGRLASLVVLTLSWVAIARTGSRGAFLGLVVLAIGLLFLVNNVPLMARLAGVASAAIVLFFVAPRGYWERMLSLTKPTDDYNWTAKDGRKQIAKRGLHYMINYPIAGVGINNFGRAEGTISEKALDPDPRHAGVRWIAPHNSYVQAGAELGVPGFACWIAMLLMGILIPLRLRRRLPTAWLRGDPEQRFLYLATSYLPVSMLGFAVTCSFVSFAYLDPVYILVALTAGLGISTEVALDRVQHVRSARARLDRARVASLSIGAEYNA